MRSTLGPIVGRPGTRSTIAWALVIAAGLAAATAHAQFGVPWRRTPTVQRHLASRGLFTPAVLAGPSPLGRGLAVAEAYVDRGAAVAYSARCGHARARDERHRPGTFQHLVATQGHRLLTL